MIRNRDLMNISIRSLLAIFALFNVMILRGVYF